MILLSHVPGNDTSETGEYPDDVGLRCVSAVLMDSLKVQAPGTARGFCPSRPVPSSLPFWPLACLQIYVNIRIAHVNSWFLRGCHWPRRAHYSWSGTRTNKPKNVFSSSLRTYPYTEKKRSYQWALFLLTQALFPPVLFNAAWWFFWMTDRTLRKESGEEGDTRVLTRLRLFPLFVLLLTVNKEKTGGLMNLRYLKGGFMEIQLVQL